MGLTEGIADRGPRLRQERRRAQGQHDHQQHGPQHLAATGVLVLHHNSFLPAYDADRRAYQI
jgi:hypothetical protein